MRIKNREEEATLCVEVKVPVQAVSGQVLACVIRQLLYCFPFLISPKKGSKGNETRIYFLITFVLSAF